MKSIDRLREYVEKAPRTSISLMARSILLGMVRTIEQEAEDELKAKDGQMWLRGYGECHAQLVEGNEVIAADLEKAGWVKLPVDAEGVPIQLGDYLESDEYGGKQFPCRGLNVEVCTSGKRWTVCMSYDSYSGTSEYTSANRCHHVKPPTVEDVLREFVDEVWNRYCNGATASDSGIRELEAEYAAKLRLADHAEA